MSETCNQQCSGCETDCGERKPESLIAAPHAMSRIKKVIGVISGKGGVGKTLVTSMLAVSMKRAGHSVAILDADITGPSIPRAFGLTEMASVNEMGLLPVKSGTGIPIMSVNLLMEDVTDPVVWRGPVIGGTVKQFWTDVIWGEVDYMFVDLPPGTGDVPLTVFQSLPLDGIVVVTSPQELVGMIVEKAVKMAGLMDIPVLALVENMSYFSCPDCGGKHYIFGESHIDRIAVKYGIFTVCKMPIEPKLAAATDGGTIESFAGNDLDALVRLLESLESDNNMRIAVAYDNGQIFQHFGHTESFKVYDFQNGILESASIISASGSGHGALAGFLKQNQVDTLICGGIGAGAKQALEAAGIRLYAGVTGSANQAVADLLTNRLNYNPDEECEHRHSHEHGPGCDESCHQ